MCDSLKSRKGWPIEMAKRRRKARCIVIAGPNGAGKTTFARRYLPEHGVIHFVNADLIASGLSPLKPDLAAIAAARMLLRELDRLAAERIDFAFETTLSGLSYVRRLQTWKQAGYRVEIVYLRLGTTQLPLRRIASRVRQGGHNGAGRTSRTCIADWRTAGPCTTTRATNHGFWRRVHEGENTSESGPPRRFCNWSRARFTSCG